MDSGFIILQRKITENWLWLSEPFSKAQAWVDLLLLANHSNGSFFIRGVKVEIKRGEVGKSEESLSQRWKWSRGKVRAFLKLLESEQQIKQHRSPIINTIQIINYDNYQNLNNRPNNRKTTERQQKDTNNKELNNEEIIIKKEIDIPDFIDKNLLNDFFSFRESIATKKEPFTDRAKELIMKDLIKFESKQAGFANQALENSIKSSWKGVFEPKINNNFQKPTGMPKIKPDTDYYKDDGGFYD
jgi:hypothetical protein